jgi:SpoVK/Ycf46/Vps4 family AAA+-type ATPase
LEQDLVQLARLALSGREQDVQTYVVRAARRWRSRRPGLAAGLADLARSGPSRLSPLRGGVASTSLLPSPVDADSRLELVRHELVDVLVQAPLWDPQVSSELTALKDERLHADRLELAGLDPTRTALFVGPPGVGKTLAARQLAHDLDLPLLVLDLAAVMSSFLGKTGGNLRQVMDYAKSRPCVLLLDELDAVAKRRDDVSEIGELKRLVTVLLQAIDDWPATGLLLAATNHPGLLDPAVWRRFERVVMFPLPSSEEVLRALVQFLDHDDTTDRRLLESLSEALGPVSYSDVEQVALRLRRSSALEGTPLRVHVERELLERAGRLAYGRRLDLACAAVRSGRLTQRRASELLGVSRDSIRKAMQREPAVDA